MVRKFIVDLTCLIIAIAVPYLLAFKDANLNSLDFWREGSGEKGGTGGRRQSA